MGITDLKAGSPAGIALTNLALEIDQIQNESNQLKELVKEFVLVSELDREASIYYESLHRIEKKCAKWLKEASQ